MKKEKNTLKIDDTIYSDQTIYGEDAQIYRSFDRNLEKPVSYISDVIKSNHQEFKYEISKAYQKYCDIKNEHIDPNKMSWAFYDYNIFSLTSPSVIFYDLFLELRNVIRKHVTDHKLWLQSWVNIHDSETLYSGDGLSWHSHPWTYHGYIVIEPKKTKTEFGNRKGETLFVIENEVGTVHFYHGDVWHRVQPLDDSQWNIDDPRITLGFDINTSEHRETVCSFIPLP